MRQGRERNARRPAARPRPAAVPASARRASAQSLTWPALILLGLFALFTGGLLAVYFAPHPELLFGRDKQTQDFSGTLTITLHGSRFSIPRPYILQLDRRIFGPVTRVTLRIPWPFAGKVAIADDQAGDIERIVTIDLTARTERTSTAERLKRIYPVYLDGPGEAVNRYLIRYRFRPNSPYGDTVLYVAQPAPGTEPLLFHCVAERDSAIPPLCEGRQAVTPEVAAVYRFHVRHVADWRSLEAAIADLLREFRGNPQPPSP